MNVVVVFLLSFYIFSHCFSSELINEFNFSASIDGLYKLEDGRTFESSSLKGHIKNNIGNTMQKDNNDDILLLLKIMMIMLCIYGLSSFIFSVLFKMFL